MTTATVTQRKLDLGSGAKKDDSFVSFDITTVLSPNVQGDGRRLPFKDSVFSEVRAWHVLEHIPKQYLIECVNECWRVLEDDGAMDIEVPVFPSEAAMADPTHVSLLVAKTFDYFIKNGIQEEHRVLYGIKPWIITDMQMIGMADILRLVMRKVAE